MSLTMNPYLNFDGTAGKAIELYERVFGAKAEQVSRFGDMPGGNIAEEHKHRVMHARIPVGGTMLMLSDIQPGQPAPPTGNVTVCLQLDDVAEARTKFDALAEGGKIEMPLAEMFWGATFGLLIDAFGVPWMFNCEKPKA